MLPSGDVQGQFSVCKPRKAFDQFLVIVAEDPRGTNDDLGDAFGLVSAGGENQPPVGESKPAILR